MNQEVKCNPIEQLLLHSLGNTATTLTSVCVLWDFLKPFLNIFGYHLSQSDWDYSEYKSYSNLYKSTLCLFVFCLTTSVIKR